MKIMTATIALGLTAAASGQLTEDFKLTASDAATFSYFGESVAISDGVCIVGAFGTDDAGEESGSAYLFDSTTGQQLFKLTAADAAEYDNFGCSVAISGTTAIVGARSDNDGGFGSGSAYLFDTTTGQQLFKLTAADAAEFDDFGFSVAISGTTALIGAHYDDDAGSDSGSAYLFDTTTGQQLFKLTASDAAADDDFGRCVAISGTIAIVGALGNDDAGDSSGSAYVFDTATGQQLFKLTASDATEFDFFGGSVAISGSTIVVGATGNDVDTFTGSAYLFDATTGEQRFKLTASDAAPSDLLGLAVAISGTTALIGAAFDDDGGPESGSAYLFDTSTGEQLLKLTASDASTEDRFGSSVAISGYTCIVGAWQDDGFTGSGYVYDVAPLCPGDIADDFGTLGADGMVSFGDFLALLGLVGPCPGGVPGCTGDIADDFGTLNGGDGMVSFGDFLALLGLVGPCP